MKAEIGCSCGSRTWKYSEPLTDDSQMECAECGAVTTYGKAMDATKDAVTKAFAQKLRDQLGGIDGFTVE